MAKQQTFDGIPVVLYEGRFGGTVDLEPAEASELRFDDEVTLVVTARVTSPVHNDTKLGDLKRTNVLKVSEAVLLTAEIADAAFNAIAENGGYTPPAQQELVVEVEVEAEESTAKVASNGSTVTVDEIGDREVIGRVGRSDEELAEFVDA